MDEKATVVISSSNCPIVYIIDAKTGTKRGNCKTNTNAPNASVCVRGLSAIGQADMDYFVAGQTNKNIVHFYHLSKDQPFLRCALQERIEALDVSPDGKYLCGGTSSGKLFMWDVPSGELIKAWDAHYKAVSVIKFSMDGNTIVSAGQDAVINVWNFVDIVDETSDDNSSIEPLFVWGEHTLPVTGLAMGSGICSQRVVSCSLDRSLKVWDLGSGRLIHSIALPAALLCVTMDAFERNIFVGSTKGTIFRVHLATVAAKEGVLRKSSDEERDDDFDENAFDAHEGPVRCVAISNDGRTLFTGGDDQKMLTWDTMSLQVIRTFDELKGSISSIHLINRPHSLEGRRKVVDQFLAPLKPLKKFVRDRSVRGGCVIGSLEVAENNSQIIESINEKQTIAEIELLTGSSVDEVAKSRTELQQLRLDVDELRVKEARWKKVNAELLQLQSGSMANELARRIVEAEKSQESETKEDSTANAPKRKRKRRQ
eukprot:TRINITY_DN61395_c0_g1_i1.p1 TRINITY_DN61395_c0_g1~~TRINITY_DN61395_c0_g1_i1.p1  ORF type:complete len:484 (+),score=164.06 TRINITY_DN61395_c0_g1_i1:69-1520(+)